MELLSFNCTAPSIQRPAACLYQCVTVVQEERRSPLLGASRPSTVEYLHCNRLYQGDVHWLVGQRERQHAPSEAPAQ